MIDSKIPKLHCASIWADWNHRKNGRLYYTLYRYKGYNETFKYHEFEKRSAPVITVCYTNESLVYAQYFKPFLLEGEKDVFQPVPLTII